VDIEARVTHMVNLITLMDFQARSGQGQPNLLIQAEFRDHEQQLNQALKEKIDGRHSG
jgi:hypothetical protein